MELASGKTRGMEHGMKPKALERELEWLQDPRALADRVGRLLNAGDVVSATALFRHAHKERMPITAAWNRLMQYCMDRYHWKAAYKFYNDVSLSLDSHGLHRASETLSSRACLANQL